MAPYRVLTLRRLLLGVLVLLLASCSVNRLAVQWTADALTGLNRSTVFTGEDDPELVAESLPLLLKTNEVLLEQLPDHAGLNLQTGSLTVMYASAFVQGPAELLPVEAGTQKREALARAERLYRRAERVLATALERRFPGLWAALEADRAGPLLARAQVSDVPLLYWESAAVMSAFALAPLDIGLSVKVKAVHQLMARAYSLDPDWNLGGLDEFYISFYGALPASLGGSRDRADRHFEAAVRKQKGAGVGPYVAYATALSVPLQDFRQFRLLIEAALAVDLEANPELRLVNTLGQRKARWLLENQDNLFLDTELN